jgi:hypothetical protein
MAFFTAEDGRTHRIGSFPDERAAAIAHDEVTLFVFRRRDRLNFPRRETTPRSPEVIRRDLAAAAKQSHKMPYRGVAMRRDRRRGRAYQASGRYARRDESLGNWKTAREAALAHDRAELFYRPERARLNLPELARALGPASAEELRNESRRRFKTQTWSRFRGVCFNRRRGTWNARVRAGSDYVHVGDFDSEDEAAHAYDRVARRLHGPKAKLNFDPATGAALLWKETWPSLARKRGIR